MSWNRMADSLLYSGLSVPLLEYGVKIWLMGEVFQVTRRIEPLLVVCSHFISEWILPRRTQPVPWLAHGCGVRQFFFGAFSTFPCRWA